MQNAPQVAPLFWFCSLDPSRATAEELFLNPIWFVPFRGDPVPLSPGMVQVASGFPSHYLSPEQMAQFLEAINS